MKTVKRQNKKIEQAKRVRLPSYGTRRKVVLAVLALAAVVLVLRVVDRQIFETEFLQREGARRYLRDIEVSADRGMITDRHGEPLAVSTPVYSIWVDPKELASENINLSPLAKALGLKLASLKSTLKKQADRTFLYLRRRVSPDISDAVSTLKLSGVHLEREYRRFYPAGEVTGHVIGFTNVDDVGQEGLELAFEQDLAGKTGKKRVLRDGRRRIVSDVESLQPAIPGEQLQLSLDLRLQFLAYRELKAAVEEHNAVAGSAVLLDVRSGEILAMVNQPSYNPNGSKAQLGGRLRNRVVTDVFEPGSTMKPFIIAAALESGNYTPASTIDTSPGRFNIGRSLVRDSHDYGVLDMAGIIRKSSNVGTSKVALSLPKESLWTFLNAVGFGNLVGSGFPGEVSGLLNDYKKWRPFDQATLSFGYGVSTTTLQLARAYATLARDGAQPEIRLLHSTRAAVTHQVMSKQTARLVRGMLASVVSPEGTAPLAAVAGYKVGGKTGTAKKAIQGGYADKRYQAVFAGIAPLDDPRLVLVVMIDEPRAGKFYGGVVAAPVFSKVMAGALRMLDISPDETLLKSPQMAAVKGAG